MKNTITLKYSDAQKFFRAYVDIIQPLLDIRPRESDILAQILYINNEKKAIPETDRFGIIFSTSSKKKMREALEINDSTLQNSLSILRKKKIIVNNTIPTKYQVFITNNELSVEYKLKLINEVVQ
ncbi:MAG TPA: hypothetical protein VJN02_07955 [Gammaproteobacteria bacterium]|nr:hypothetical protein [Gammaproteobacteria bacterium]